MAEEIVETPESTSKTYAGFSDRACARIIDLGVLSAFGLPLWGVYYLIALYGEAPSAVLAWRFLGFPLYVAYFAIMTARSGQTFGKRIMGIRVQGQDARPPRPSASLWRAIIDLIFMQLLNFIVGFLDYLWLYRRKDRRTLHDLAIGTSVRIIRPWPSNVGLILLAALLLMTLTPRDWLVQSGSQDLDNMSPTIRKGEWWEANRLAYRRHSPKLGDIVAFKPPIMLAGGRPVGRIVGLPGDQLIFRNGQLTRLPARPQGDEDARWLVVPPGYVALLGDNRATPEAGGYPRGPAAWMPPPPLRVPAGRVPAPGPQRPAKPMSPIVLVEADDISGKVIGVTSPLWRMRVVR
ncbi:MAG: signal peptidase I [Armatimonadota bacterium]